jgi:hypothetical protein
MPTPSAAKIFTTILAGSILAGVAAVGACGSSGAITPTCDYNIDDAGNIRPDPNPCVQFASCDLGEPSACCVDADGGPLTGNDLANCLYGYGACASISTDDAGNTTCVQIASGTGGGGTGGGGTGGDGGTVDGG